jgi:hypothetical protein
MPFGSTVTFCFGAMRRQDSCSHCESTTTASGQCSAERSPNMKRSSAPPCTCRTTRAPHAFATSR